MKVRIEASEVYPVYNVDFRDLRYSTEVDVPEEKAVEWRKIHSAWLKAQREMKDEVSKAQHIEVEINEKETP